MKILSQILKPGRFILILLACVTALYFSVKVTQPDMVKLVTSAPKARVILSQLLSPKILTKVSETSSTSFVFPLPCGSAPNQEPTTDGPRVYVDPPCANAKDKISIIGEGLPANVDVPLKWKLPSGDYLSIATVKTDSNGAFREEVIARPIAATINGVPAILEAEICDHLYGAFGNHNWNSLCSSSRLPGCVKHIQEGSARNCGLLSRPRHPECYPVLRAIGYGNGFCPDCWFRKPLCRRTGSCAGYNGIPG